MKNKATPDLFDLLKSLVDHRAKKLRYRVQDVNGMEKRISELQSQIYSLENFISNNRYDRADTREAESEIAGLESEISSLTQQIAAAKSARAELHSATRFYQIYDEAIKPKPINTRTVDSIPYVYVENDWLDDTLDSLRITLDNRKYVSPDLYEQSLQDYQDLMTRCIRNGEERQG